MTLRLDSLTGLRFFAAFAVFGFHFQGLDYGKGDRALHEFSGGMVGVTFFFMVSGFVLAWSSRPNDTTRSFYRRRFARIYPSYLMAWVIAVGVGLASGWGFSAKSLIALPLIQAWAPSQQIFYAASAVFWSLSCEAFFYAVFPYVMRRLRSMERRELVIIGLVCVLFSLALAGALIEVGETTAGFWILCIFPPVQLATFILGMVLGILMRGGPTTHIPLWPAVALALAATMLAGHVPASLARVALPIVPFALVIWAAAERDLRGMSSIFRSRALVALGTWSYCFYLIHGQVIQVSIKVMHRAGVETGDLGGIELAGMFVLVLAAATFSAWVLHRVVEFPCERRLRGAAPERVD